jgi:hypothetical protein
VTLYSIICREGGAGSGGHGKRTRGPRRRPAYIAHVAAFWTPDTAAQHLADCRTGRDGEGEWRPWEELSEGERWAWWWEECGGYEPMGPVTETRVP